MLSYEKKLGFNYVRCDFCRSLYANPCPEKELLAEYYRDSESSQYWAEVFFPTVSEIRREKIFRDRANKINDFFFEVVIAKGFKKDALKILKKKKNLRLIDAKNFNNKSNFSLLFNNNTFLYQSSDSLDFNKKNFEIVSKTKPSKNQMDDLIFAFNICKFVRSNAIVICKNKSTLGIGAGQPSRLDSCKIAIEKANTFRPLIIENSVAASDAFFPFPDGPEKLIQAGVSSIIQPRGSIRDKEIIKLANKTKTVLVFSKTRHFKH